MTAIVVPDLFPQFFSQTGINPLVGGLLFSYMAGTSIKQPTYLTSTISVGNQQSNPIVLNAAGMIPSGGLWLDQSLAYKFVLSPANDTDPPASPIATIDNIAASVPYPVVPAEI